MSVHQGLIDVTVVTEAAGTLLVLIHATATLDTDSLEAIAVLVCLILKSIIISVIFVLMLPFLYNYAIDINECSSSSTNNCAQICNNNPGSYTCSCRTGYRLNSDRRTCNGKCMVRISSMHINNRSAIIILFGNNVAVLLLAYSLLLSRY